MPLLKADNSVAVWRLSRLLCSVSLHARLTCTVVLYSHACSVKQCLSWFSVRGQHNIAFVLNSVLVLTPDSIVVLAAGRVLDTCDGPASRTKSKTRGQGHC